MPTDPNGKTPAPPMGVRAGGASALASLKGGLDETHGFACIVIGAVLLLIVLRFAFRGALGD